VGNANGAGEENRNVARMASLLALSGAVLGGGHAYGQDAATPAGQAPGVAAAPVDASAANTNDLQEVVVTATANGGVKKLDASFQITTASLEEIKDVNPSSSADLLKIVPSVWAYQLASARAVTSRRSNW